MELTELGLALVVCSGLAVGLFCWLAYASLAGPPADHQSERHRSAVRGSPQAG